MAVIVLSILHASSHWSPTIILWLSLPFSRWRNRLGDLSSTAKKYLDWIQSQAVCLNLTSSWAPRVCLQTPNSLGWHSGLSQFGPYFWKLFSLSLPLLLPPLCPSTLQDLNSRFFLKFPLWPHPALSNSTSFNAPLKCGYLCSHRLPPSPSSSPTLLLLPGWLSAFYLYYTLPSLRCTPVPLWLKGSWKAGPGLTHL